LLAEGDPRAEGQRGQLQAGFSKTSILHGSAPVLWGGMGQHAKSTCPASIAAVVYMAPTYH
jgi:hypothetical protein